MFKMNRKSGFTLVEIVASLVLVGFMSVFAGSVIVTFTKGYLFTKENAHMVQKAQLAMSRINRELMELLNVTAASPTAITNEGAGQNLTSFDDPTVPADSWIILLTTALSGTVTELTVTIRYTID